MINLILKIIMTVPVFLAETLLLLVCEICCLLTFKGKFMENDFLKMTKTIWSK
jgi:hypothetical protein